MDKYDYYIGIDPDVDKSGIAWLDYNARAVKATTLTFPALIERLCLAQYEAEVESGCRGATYIVLIEAGWLNYSNWHLSPTDTKRSAAAKGNATGRNHEVGRKIAECCEYWRIPYRLVKPLRKKWSGKDGKITHDELAYFTHIEGRTNQEARDAALIAWTAANLPIKVKPITKTKKQ